MERLTKQNEQGQYIVDEAQLRQAIDRLAQFENAYDGLCEDMRRLPGQLEKLRMEGKEKTVRYRELFAQKLTNSHIQMFLRKYGIVAE